MRRALALARRGRATVAPNPVVGAVVLSPDGRRLGEGWHQAAGGPHAEVTALVQAGAAARGATLVVTLEPCAHCGRTPPCVDAVLAAGIRRVVACHRDPDPRTAGAGFARLAAAGVEVVSGVETAAAIAINLPFLVSRVFGRPAVTLKWAASLDGKIATVGGESRWITGAAARRRALELREEHAAVAVGSGTVLADDPRLTRRLGWASGPIVRVVLDRRLRLPPTARLFESPSPLLVYTESRDAERAARLTSVGAEVLALDVVEPRAVLADLGRRGLQSVLVEGGGEMASAFVAAGAWDRAIAFLAPCLIGGATAPSPLAGSGVAALGERERLTGVAVRRRGEDFEITGMRERCLLDLSSSVGA